VGTSTRARLARSSLRAAGALLLLATAGCSWWGQDRTCASATDATAEVVTPAEVEVGDRTQWVVVAVQEGCPVQVEVWQEEPVYG
jgi:hypothetical protein